MKKLSWEISSSAIIGLLIVIISIILFKAAIKSSDETRQELKNERKPVIKTITESIEREHSIININGCEYIVYIDYNLNLSFMSHKGDCKNPIHIYNKKSTVVTPTSSGDTHIKWEIKKNLSKKQSNDLYNKLQSDYREAKLKMLMSSVDKAHAELINN